MKENKQRVIGAVLGYANIAVGMIVSLLYTPLMLSILGPSEYGVYTNANSIVGYLNLLGFGLAGSYLRFSSEYLVNKDKKGLAQLNGTYLTVFSLICVATWIIGGFIVVGADAFFATSLSATELELTKKLLVVLVFRAGITFPLSVFSSYISLYERFVFLQVVNILRAICSPLISILVLTRGYGSVGMVVVTTAIGLAAEMAQFVFCLHKLSFKVSFVGNQKVIFKEIAGFSIFIFIQSITDQINWSLDNTILTKMMGTVAVARYGLGAQLNTYMRNFSTVITSVYLPKVNKLVAANADRDAVMDLYISVARVQFLIVTFVVTGFALWGREFINLWVGSGYDESYYVALILMMAVTPAMFLNLGIEIRRAYDKHKIPAIATFITAWINAVVTVFLIKLFGVSGAALGTMGASFCNIIFINIYYTKALSLNMWRLWKQILGLSVPVVICLIIGQVSLQI